MISMIASMKCVSIEPHDMNQYKLYFKIDEGLMSQETFMEDFQYVTNSSEEAFEYNVGEYYDIQLSVTPTPYQGGIVN